MLLWKKNCAFQPSQLTDKIFWVKFDSFVKADFKRTQIAEARGIKRLLVVHAFQVHPWQKLPYQPTKHLLLKYAFWYYVFHPKEKKNWSAYYNSWVIYQLSYNVINLTKAEQEKK
jgi:hypothetical protein